MSLSLQTTPHKGLEVFNYFENLLPDSKALRERIQSRLKIRSSHPFDILYSIGRDCVGAIQLVEENEKPTEPRLDGVVLNDENIAQTLAQFEHLPLGMSREEKDFRISLAGAQEKMAFLRRGSEWLRPLGNTPTSHIFKLPIGRVTQHEIDLSTSCEKLVTKWLEEMSDRALSICETMPSTLSKDFPQEVSQAIFDGLKQQALKIQTALS